MLDRLQASAINLDQRIAEHEHGCRLQEDRQLGQVAEQIQDAPATKRRKADTKSELWTVFEMP